jgi:F-type H+-transporting ATPase subunit b
MQELFSAFGVSWKLLIAQAINFGIVLVALWYFLYKPVMAMLAKRQALVSESVREAKHIEELFAQADGEAENRLKKADVEAGQIVASAHELASSEKTRLLKEADARAASIAKDAEAKAKEALVRAQRESERDIARLSILAAEKILREYE